MPTTKKPRTAKSPGRRSASSKATATTTRSRGGTTARRPRITKKLWAYVKPNGRADRDVQRPIFDTPVQLRNLDDADIARMVSGAKVKLS